MKITYILPDFNEFAYSGGLYVIFQHCNGMIERGHEVRVFNNTGKKSAYLRLDCPVEVHKNDPSVIESSSPDIIVGTYWHTYFFINRMKDVLKNNTKLCFLVQGDDRLIYDRINVPLIYKSMKSRYRDVIPVCKITVSRYLEHVLKDDFDEESFYIRNGLDFKNVAPLLDISAKKRIVARYDTSSFRGWEMVDRVLDKISKERDDIEIHLFEMKYKKPTGYRSIFHKGLFGDELLRLFKSCDIYLSGSRYEGFGYPIIEAMSQGACVCCTDAGGNRDFCIEGETAMLSSIDDAEALHRNLFKLLDDANLRDKLKRQGIIKSKQFSWKESLDRLEAYFLSINKMDYKKYIFLDSIKREETDYKKKEALFVYGTDPFVNHRDWINFEESLKYLSRNRFRVRSRILVDRHPIKFVKARFGMLFAPDDLPLIKCSVFYIKKLKFRIPLVSAPIFSLFVIADILSSTFSKAGRYSCVVYACNSNVLIKLLCDLLGIRFFNLDFKKGGIADYSFDNYTKEGFSKEASYRILIDKTIEELVR